MGRVVRLVVLALLSGLLVSATSAAPSLATSPGVRSSSSHELAGARQAGHHRKKHRRHKRKHKTAKVPPNPWLHCWPGIPSLSGKPTPGGVQFQWGGTSCATRYRVHVSPAWYGEWPGNPWYTAWTGSRPAA